MDSPRLYASRLVVRFLDDDRPYLGQELTGQSVPLYADIEAIVGALWDRDDLRSNEERLAELPLYPQKEHLHFLLQTLIEAGLLVEEGEDEVAAWHRHHEENLDPLPRIDQIELTNACPFTCIFCPRGLGQMTRPLGHFDLGLLQEIVDQVKDLPPHKPFGLHHFGDPLLHPDPAAAVRIVRQAGLEPELSLNPILLRPDLAADLLDAGIGVLIVSLDGLDTETLHKMRGPRAGTFEEVEERLEQLISLASQLAQPPTIMISMVATTLNRHQWDELFRRYRRPELPWLVPVVRLLEDFGDPQIIPFGVQRLRQICAAPYHFVSILCDGTVVPCCHDYDGVIPLGDLREQSLQEIWQGETLARFRQRWKKQEFHPKEPCARCHWRVDRYIACDQIAYTDAWTPALWPQQPLPQRPNRS